MLLLYGMSVVPNVSVYRIGIGIGIGLLLIVTLSKTAIRRVAAAVGVGGHCAVA